MNDMMNVRRAGDVAWHHAALALVAELEGRGLEAKVMGYGAVRARNPAGEPDPDDRQGQAFSPGLRQDLYCRRRDVADDGVGALWWNWAWSGPTRTSPPEMEPLCPIEDTRMAADRVARVLAVPFTSSTGSLDGGV